MWLFSSPIGTLCKLTCDNGTFVTGEIIGFREKKSYCYPWSKCKFSFRFINWSISRKYRVEVGQNILGRVIDAFGQPIDDNNELFLNETWPLSGKNINPMKKNPIKETLDVGIKAINTLFTVGRGQRLGIIAGSGVGKSILLGMMTKFTEADIVVVALIGERGRELGNFVSEVLNDETKKRTTIVAVPADKSPLLRIKGAERATSLQNILDLKEKMFF